MSKNFKIIGTVGPASANAHILGRLKKLGLDSYRINLSHANAALVEDYYTLFDELGISPSLDTQGAQARVSFKSDHNYFDDGERILLSHSKFKENNEGKFIGINQEDFFKQLSEGDEIKIGFDGLILKIIESSFGNNQYLAKVINAGPVELNKAVDISNQSINLPAFTEFDLQCIQKSIGKGVKEIFISFCDNAESITFLKDYLIQNGCAGDQIPEIIAKIESRKGILNLEKIIVEADGILIDRGDLSRELKISRIPGLVSSIIKTSFEHSKPCFVATNILDSMLVESLPSRAEISDIYNLLSMGVSGLVLAAEMAIGKHPVESVQVLKVMENVFHHQKQKTGVLPLPQEVIPDIQEPLKSWL